MGELQDFTLSRLVEPLCDPDPVGILWEGERIQEYVAVMESKQRAHVRLPPVQWC